MAKQLIRFFVYFLAFMAGYMLPTALGWRGSAEREYSYKDCKIDTIRTIDTVRLSDPKLKSEIGLGTVYFRVPRAIYFRRPPTTGTGAGGLERQCTDVATEYIATRDSMQNSFYGTGAGGEPRCCDDSVVVELPIVQRVYEDDGYTAWVSGVQAKLDSIAIYQKRETVIIKQPPNRWHLGPAVGIGFTTRGIEPYVGIGLTYSIINF